MCDNNCCSILRQSVDSFLNRPFTFRVKRARGFIQKQNGCIAKNCACDCNPLFLPTRQHDPPFADICFISLWKLRNKLMRRCQICRADHLFIAGVLPAKTDIFQHAVGENHGVLWHKRYSFAKIFPTHIAKINTIQQYTTALRIVKPQKQLDNCCLSRPRWPHYSHRLPGFDIKRNIIKRAILRT